VLEAMLDELLNWKMNTIGNNTEDWGPCVATILSVLFMFGWCLIHICYCYFIGCLEYDRRLWEMCGHIFVQHDHFL
jgi:hypothetical protein